jgi:hypothetical protein
MAVITGDGKARRLGGFRGRGVSPVFCGDNGRDSALSYARQRAGYSRCDIEVLDRDWQVVETIGNEDLKPVV